MQTWTEEHVERVLEWYEKDPGDALVGEEVLKGFGLAELQALFGISHDDPDDPEMYLKYEVEQDDVLTLQQAVAHPIDLAAYDYFVAAYQKGT